MTAVVIFLAMLIAFLGGMYVGGSVVLNGQQEDKDLLASDSDTE